MVDIYSPLGFGQATKIKAEVGQSMMFEREREIMVFMNSLASITQGAQPSHALFFIGEAGAGKTALMSRVFTLCASQKDAITTLYVDADPTEGKVKLALWRHVVLQVCHVIYVVGLVGLYKCM